jgi:hypothetical protein
MAIKTSRVTVTTTATRLDTQTDADYGRDQEIMIIPAADVYVGGPDVSTANGVLIVASSTLAITLPADSPIYGRAASGTVVVQVMQVGV